MAQAKREWTWTSLAVALWLASGHGLAVLAAIPHRSEPLWWTSTTARRSGVDQQDNWLGAPAPSAPGMGDLQRGRDGGRSTLAHEQQPRGHDPASIGNLTLLRSLLLGQKG